MLKLVEVFVEFISLNVDIMIVVVYGLLLLKVILDVLCLGCLNVYGFILLCWCGVVLI